MVLFGIPVIQTMPQIDDDSLRRILAEARVVAVVGVSANPIRPSRGVAEFLHAHGKRVIGINPGLAGQVMFGNPVLRC